MGNIISIETILNKTISFSMFHNKTFVINKLRLINETENEYRNLSVKVSFVPEFTSGTIVTVPLLNANDRIEIDSLGVNLDFAYLSSLTEAETAKMTVGVYEGEVLLESTEIEIKLLAYNEWNPDGSSRELLASFVMPNHPKVKELLPLCGKVLEKWTGNPSITGYLSENINDVKKQVAAAYEVLKEEAIAYIVPPASYEGGSQKIRNVGEVFENKQGTCLDLALTFASLLEAMGLNPVIVLEKDHAYAGCWLVKKSFTDCIQDDFSALNKRIADGINELILVETTFFTAGQSASFEAAAERGIENFKNEKNFEEAIDISRCRGCGILPMPVKVTENGESRLVEFEAPGKMDKAPNEIAIDGNVSEVTENVLTKQKLWERKLLDLSLRNPLLNFRVNKNVVQLMAPDLARLEDELNDGETFTIFEVPAESKITAGEDKIYNPEGEFRDWAKTNSESEFENKRIRTFLEYKDLDVAMKYLSRQAKLSLEENGSNTLYLAEGFLKWYEPETGKERYAPLILVPVDITKKIQEKNYRIKIRDEEAQINVTLLEYLRQEFNMDIGGLDPLPADDHGINVNFILNTIRQSIMEKAHWDVCEFCFIGIFSFSRFIMWNDLRNRSDEIFSNKVVKSLIEGKMTWEPVVNTKELDNPDERLKPSDMAVVMSADSSQLMAIETASKGESFVLHGPPGSGKSQTITNMIANALYQGKSVLFVAEKMAALSVVQKRLEKVGLGPFCLELHSNKAQKSAVLSQLEKTLTVSNLQSPEEYEAVANKLFEQRKSLNDIVDELHKKRENGFSVYELVGLYEENREYDGKISFTGQWAAGLSKEDLEKCFTALSDMKVVAKECGDLLTHPLREFSFPDYSMQLKEEFVKLAGEYGDICAEEVNIIPKFVGMFGSSETYTVPQICYIENVLNLCGKTEVILPKLLEGGNALSGKERIETQIQSGRDVSQAKAELLKEFKPSIFTYDVAAARNRLVAAQGKWLLAKKKDISSLVKELSFLALNPSSVSDDKLEGIYDRLDKFNELKNNVSIDESFAQTFEGIYNKEETDWDKLAKCFIENLSLCNAVWSVNIGEEMKTAVSGRVCAPDFKEYLSGLKPEIDKFLELRAKSVISENALMEKFGLDWNMFFSSSDFFGYIKEAVSRWISSSEEMRSYAALCSKERTLSELGLGELLTLFKNGELKAEEFEGVLKCNFGRSAATEYISHNDILAHFNGAGFNATISNFREITEKFEILSVKETVAKLSTNIPQSGEGISSSSEVGVLQKQIKNPRRAMPIRKLFNEIPTLLRRMCPCMLMSPISVAQYIDPSFPKFDLVIFDEASQIPTGEAAGALARGENVVVVGDPKQLPPTSFFMTNQQDEENYEIEDMESLLDDCLAISMPEQHLLWHYRSRHESLIAYSNATYYDNKLLSFPSPNDLVSQVKLVKVEGFYDRGKTKQNRAEAEKVVEEIINRLKNPETSKDSIGVVTFNIVQQNLIEDLLTEKLNEDEEALNASYGLEEPIFVKNLENVQGDERDVILFSIGYGPDRDGKVGMNFGPLNQEGGWRRLNVAISRSRKEMVIFTSIRPEQIRISNTTAEGVVGLKGFLEFAEKGKNALFVRSDCVNEKNSSVAKAIAKKLNEAGYKTNTDIGSSEYKIDIGVIHPENSDEYCLGILVDGENYNAAKCARDRNILQPSVLDGLGWNLHRVWTLDWFDTPDRELKKIIERIEEVLTPPPTDPTDGEPTDISLSSESDTAEGEDNLQEEVKEDDSLGYMSLRKAEKQDNSMPYVFYRRDPLGDSESFREMKNNIQIEKLAKYIIDCESPISSDYLKKRIISFWGMKKMTKTAEERLNDVCETLQYQTTAAGGKTFFWSEGMNPQEYGIYRSISKEKQKEIEESVRTLGDIAPEEMTNAVCDIVKQNISLSWEDVIKELSVVFGTAKADASGESVANAAISLAESRGNIQVSDDGAKVSWGRF